MFRGALILISLILKIKGHIQWFVFVLLVLNLFFFFLVWKCQMNRRANFLFIVSSGIFAVGWEWWKPLYCCAGRSHNPERNTVFSRPILLARVTIPHFIHHAAVPNDCMAGNRYGGYWQVVHRPLSLSSWCLSRGIWVDHQLPCFSHHLHTEIQINICQLMWAAVLIWSSWWNLSKGK